MQFEEWISKIKSISIIDRIKELYTPIQPAVGERDQDVDYLEIKPSGQVSGYIYCYWQLKTTKKLKHPFSYRVVSDGCIDIFFEKENPKANFVMGFFRKYTAFDIGQTFNYIGIRFLPAAFVKLFDVDAKSLSNQSQPVDNVLPELSMWIGNLNTQHKSIHAIAKTLDIKFQELIDNSTHAIDVRFCNAMEHIIERKGYLDTEKELVTGLSPRQLRRIFNYYIGTTPKAFCNVVRFQHILSAKPSRQSLKQDKIYFDVGFFDQAHFIKHFKTFYGVTPAEAFS